MPGGRRFGRWNAGISGNKGNKRVSNAKRVLMEDGVMAGSKLEASMRERLMRAGIEFEFQKVMILQPGWRDDKGKWIAPIKWIVDFHFPWCGIVLDTKGYATEVAKLKVKLFMYQHQDIRVLLPSNNRECDGEFLYILSKWVQYRSAGVIQPGVDGSDLQGAGEQPAVDFEQD